MYTVAIVGVGFGVNGHLEALSRHPEFDVVALVSPHRASTVARRRDIRHSFKSVAELLEAIDVEVVVVASPPFRHHDDVMLCLHANKHVVCEKPMALTETEVEALKELSTRSHALATIAHEFRFVPALVEIRRRLMHGCLGEIRRIDIVRHSSLLHDPSQKRRRSWWFEREAGGGILGAQMAHLIDISHWLARSSPARVAGLARNAIPEFYDESGAFDSSVDDGAAAIIEYPRGILGTISVDATLPIDEIRVTVVGDRGALFASGASFEAMELRLRVDGAVRKVLCDPIRYARFGTVNGNVPLLMAFYDHVANALSGSAYSLPTFEEGVETQRVLGALGYGV